MGAGRALGASARRTDRCRGRSSAPAARAARSRQGPGGLVRVGGLVVVVIARDRDELVHRVEVVDEELAVEMVQLVLERAAEESRSGDLDLLAVPVLSDDP